MDLSSIALQGMQQAEVQLENAATAIASPGSSPEGANIDTVDLSAEMVALMSAKNDFSVNLSVLKTADQVEKQTVDLMG